VSGEGADALQDRISSRLQKDFMEGGGYTVRKVAHVIRIPETSDTASLNGGPPLAIKHHGATAMPPVMFLVLCLR
jgi:hypothetical protein